jgi:hypothetical protein
MVQAPGFETGSRKLCVGLAWDPFVSRASGGPEPLAKAQAFRVRYLPSEDGRIPVLRERFLLSIAPDLRDHLPGSDTFRPAWLPPEEVLLVTGDSRSAADAIARLGLSGVRILETFPPDRSRLSFDLHPLSPDWTRDAVLRRGEGNWAPGTAPATYRMKPATRFRAWLDAVEAQAPSASGAARLLLLPEQPLADWTDFDIRLASAGSFRGAMDLCVAAWQPEEDGGPIPALLLEEDTGAPFGPWAGALLLSDRQGLALAGKPGSRCPPGRFLKPERIGVGGFGAWRDAFPDLQEEAVLHRFLAVQLAHGVAGRIPEPDRIRPASLAHACHVLQSLRGQIAGQTADSVAQECDGRLLDGTTARLEGATGDRVYLHYAHGLELWVNQSGDRDWEVTVGPDRWRIPPDGWVAAGPDYLNISVLVDGARIDYIQSGSFDFFRSSDGKAVFRGYSAEGPVLIRRTGDTGVEVTDYAQSGRVRIPGNERAGFLARPWDGLSETGESTGRAKAEMEGDSLVLSGPAGTRRYIRHPETGPSEESQK